MTRHWRQTQKKMSWKMNWRPKAALPVLLAGILLLTVSSCMKDFVPHTEEDFIGTEWSNKDHGWLSTLIFTDARVLLTVKGLGMNDVPNSGYGLSGVYSYDGTANVLTVTFEKFEYGYNSIKFPSVNEGRMEGKNKLALGRGENNLVIFKRQKASRQ